MTQDKHSLDLYELVTHQIIAQLQQKIVPWHKPWTDAGMPQNLISRAPYHGINLWLLASLGFEHNVFLTWKQLKVLGGSVRKGERGQIVVFWKQLPKKEHEEKPTSVLRYYKVFNVAQCTDIPEHFLPPVPNTDFVPLTEAEQIIHYMPLCPEIVHDVQEAFYSPVEDIINMPKAESFKHHEQYYSVLFHELIHSTGHQSRLKRKEVSEQTRFGDKDYSIEELTAEIGSCFLCSICGIGETHFKQSVSYISSWIKALKNDHKLIFKASGQAQKATDYILGVVQDEKS